jgi:hypothetical protein
MKLAQAKIRGLRSAPERYIRKRISSGSLNRFSRSLTRLPSRKGPVQERGGHTWHHFRWQWRNAIAASCLSRWQDQSAVLTGSAGEAGISGGLSTLEAMPAGVEQFKAVTAKESLHWGEVFQGGELTVE